MWSNYSSFVDDFVPSIMRSNSACTSRARNDSTAVDDAELGVETPDWLLRPDPVELPPLGELLLPPDPPTDFRLNNELKNVCKTRSPPGDALPDASRKAAAAAGLALWLDEVWCDCRRSDLVADPPLWAPALPTRFVVLGDAWPTVGWPRSGYINN